MSEKRWPASDARKPQAGGSIIFHDPRPQPFLISPRPGERNLYNSSNADLSVRAGMLLLFPAWLHHSIAGNAADSEGVSISFNVMFKDFGGRLARPIWGAPAES